MTAGPAQAATDALPVKRELRRLARTFSPQLTRQIFNRATLIAMSVAAFCGMVLPTLLGRFMASSGGFPVAVILASYAVTFLALGYLLARLPGNGVEAMQWRCLGAWLSSVVVAAGAFAALAVRAWDFERPMMMVVLWLLFAAQAGLITAAHGLFTLLFNRAGELARMASLLLLSVLVSSLFWTKPLIHAAGKEPIKQQAQRRTETKLSDHIATAVTKLNTPMTISAAWFLESRAGKSGDAPEGGRFDLIRGALTYSVWIGSAQGAPYPEMLPKWRGSNRDEVTDSSGFTPGLLLVLLAWSLPLIVLADLLAALSPVRVFAPVADVPIAAAVPV
jgi:hypothetical protein